MACIHIHASDGTVIGHVCRPDGETKPVPGRRRKRWWCFHCRTRDLHTLMGFYPSGLSYYGPTFWWACPRCHEEHVLFPGREWIYNE
jgi:hypothetical protein